MTDLLATEINPATFPLGTVAEWFREFYSVSPWGERWRCPACSPSGDYGAAGRYAQEDLSSCPLCGAALEPYWSDERSVAYFTDAASRSGFHGHFYKIEDQLVGWNWGYAIESVEELQGNAPGGFYVDVIGVLPPFRRQFTAKVFAAGHEMIRGYGYTYSVTRTRRDARHVHLAMSMNGYSYLKPSNDGEREYWIRSLIDD